MSCANQAFLRTTQFYSPKYLSKNACSCGPHLPVQEAVVNEILDKCITSPESHLQCIEN